MPKNINILRLPLGKTPTPPPPLFGSYKLNSDGAFCKENNNGGIRGVIRDSNGDYHTTPPEAVLHQMQRDKNEIAATKWITASMCDIWIIIDVKGCMWCL